MLHRQARAVHELGPEFALERRHGVVEVHQIELPRDLLFVSGGPLDREVRLGWNRYGFRWGAYIGHSQFPPLPGLRCSSFGFALLNHC